MKLNLPNAIVLAGFMAFSAAAQELKSDFKLPLPPDKEKISYAMGMRMGLQLMNGGPEVDASVIAQGIKDVLEGKPTKIQEPEIPLIFRQAQAYVTSKKAEKNQEDIAPALKHESKPIEAPDKEKISYAVGMRLGLQLKHGSPDVDVNVIAQGIKDVLEGKPTKLKESEITPLFEQAQAYGTAREAQKNQTAGEDFLAKNAKAQGVTVLPGGLQYRVIKEGTGEIPKTNDIVNITYHGKMVDGTEFEQRNHIMVRVVAPILGLQEALQLMKVGSKWEIFVPPVLAYGYDGNFGARKVGPNATLIYELELNSILQPGQQIEPIGRAGLGHQPDPDQAISAK